MMRLHSKIEPKEKMKAAFDNCKKISKRKEFFVAFIDANSMKRVNDQYGHLVGDKVIARLSERLATGIRKHDRIVRFGGDEFVIFLPNMKAENARGFMSRIRDRIKDDEKLADLCGKISISIGLVRYNSKIHTSMNKVLDHADSLMYEAKKQANHLVISEIRRNDVSKR